MLTMGSHHTKPGTKPVVWWLKKKIGDGQANNPKIKGPVVHTHISLRARLTAALNMASQPRRRRHGVVMNVAHHHHTPPAFPPVSDTQHLLSDF